MRSSKIDPNEFTEDFEKRTGLKAIETNINGLFAYDVYTREYVEDLQESFHQALYTASILQEDSDSF